MVPLLGGHHGANDLARQIAAGLDAHAAITTAGDLRFGVALDAPPDGYRLSNPSAAKAVMAELVAGGQARFAGTAEWIAQSRVPVSEDGAVRLTVTESAVEPGELELVYAPATLCLGIGCERGTDPQEVVALVEEVAGRCLNLSPKMRWQVSSRST